MVTNCFWLLFAQLLSFSHKLMGHSCKTSSLQTFSWHFGAKTSIRTIARLELLCTILIVVQVTEKIALPSNIKGEKCCFTER